MSGLRMTSVLSLLMVMMAAHAGAANCGIETLRPRGNVLKVRGIGAVSLGAADDLARPIAWQGPMSAGTCSLDLGIIEAPFMATSPGTVYVTTYSGAMRRVALVDLGACKIRWHSKPFVGAVQADSAGLTLGKRRLSFNAQCVPQVRR